MMNKVLVLGGLVFLLLLSSCAPQSESATVVQDSDKVESNTDREVLRVDQGSEDVKAEASRKEVVTMTEGQWMGIDEGGKEVVLRLAEVRPGSVLVKYEGESHEIVLGQEKGIDGVNLTLSSIEQNAVEKKVGSQVWFWLGTDYGAVQDMMEGGERNTYVLGDKNYEVETVFIGEGDDARGEVLFRVNGERTETLSEKGMDVFNDGEFIFVKDIYYREGKTLRSFDQVKFEVET